MYFVCSYISQRKGFDFLRSYTKVEFELKKVSNVSNSPSDTCKSREKFESTFLNIGYIVWQQIPSRRLR